MILELLTGLTGAYTVASMVNSYKKKQMLEDGTHKEIKVDEMDTEVKGLSINAIVKEKQDPVYMKANNNSNIMIPVGGYTYEREKEIYNKFINTTTRDDYENFTCTNEPFNKYYINTPEMIETTFKKYNVNTTLFPINLPLVVYEYKLEKPVYKIYHENTGVIGVNKLSVINKFVSKTRYPLTFTAGAFCVVGCVLWYNK